MSQDTGRRYLSLDGFRELVKAASDPKTIDTKALTVVSCLPTEIKTVGSEDSRLIEFIITTDRIDREQDTIAADGWDFKDYQHNPVVLWCHDHYAPVIGNSRSLSPGGNQVRSICEFTPQDLNPFGYMIYRMYAMKFMHAVSVGMMPIEYTMAADRKWGINYIKQGLLEYSCVPVPANPDALAVARSKGIDTTPMRDWASRVLDEQAGLSDEARRRMDVLRQLSAPNGRALILELGEMKMAGTQTETPPASSSSIKRVERWECGVTGHVHVSEQEAKSCADFDVAVTDVTRLMQQLQTLVKSGRTIRPEAAALMRSVIDELAPAKKEDAPKAEGEEDPAITVNEDEAGEENLNIDEAKILAAVTEAVDEQMSRLTGRVN